MNGKLRQIENAFYRRLQRWMTWISELKSDSAAMKGYRRTLSDQSAGHSLIQHARGHTSPKGRTIIKIIIEIIMEKKDIWDAVRLMFCSRDTYGCYSIEHYLVKPALRYHYICVLPVLNNWSYLTAIIR